MPKISGSTSPRRLPVRKPISLFESVLPLIVMLACLVGGRLFLPASTDLLVAVMLIAEELSADGADENVAGFGVGASES